MALATHLRKQMKLTSLNLESPTPPS